jgi:hypothetical protein
MPSPAGTTTSTATAASGCTRASVHYGTADGIQHARQRTLDAAYAAHPERFHRRPQAPTPPARVTINDPATREVRTPATKLAGHVSFDLTSTGHTAPIAGDGRPLAGSVNLRPGCRATRPVLAPQG